MFDGSVGSGTRSGLHMRAETVVGVSGAPASEILLCGVHGVILVARTSQGHL
jgi:hypothetical protein